MSTLTTRDSIQLFSLKVARAAILLEMKGLQHSRGSVTARIKKQFNWRGNRETIYNKLDAYITQLEAN